MFFHKSYSRYHHQLYTFNLRIMSKNHHARRNSASVTKCVCKGRFGGGGGGGELRDPVWKCRYCLLPIYKYSYYRAVRPTRMLTCVEDGGESRSHS